MKKTFILIVVLFFACNSFASDEFGDVDIRGFISQGYLTTTENNYFISNTKDGTFQFNEMGLNFGTDLTDNLSLGIQFFAKDLGVLGNDKIVIDWAIADYNYRDWLGLRVGKIKKASGLHNQIRDIDAGRSGIFLPLSIYDETFRDQTLVSKGVSIYGTLLDQIDYQAYYGVFDIQLGCGLDLYISRNGLTTTSFEVEPGAGINFLWNTPLEGLSLGTTYTTYKFTQNAVMPPGMAMSLEYEGYNYFLSIEFLYEDFTFNAEFQRAPNDTTTTMVGLPVEPTTDTIESEGYYGQAGYRFTNWFELGAGYSAKFSNIEIRDEPARYLKDIYFSLRFDVNDNWIIKLEGHSLDGLRGATDVDPVDPSENWFMYAAKLTFSF